MWLINTDNESIGTFGFGFPISVAFKVFKILRNQTSLLGGETKENNGQNTCHRCKGNYPATRQFEQAHMNATINTAQNCTRYSDDTGLDLQEIIY